MAPRLIPVYAGVAWSGAQTPMVYRQEDFQWLIPLSQPSRRERL